jgi:DNA-directed RNA polymerase specialized sigma24 family protein
MAKIKFRFGGLAIILKALSLLSPVERTVYVISVVEGRSTAEIAKDLGIKEKDVHHIVTHIRCS